MTVSEFYSKISGNYDEVLGRLGKEERIKKYLFKFAQEDEYKKLIAFTDNKEWEEAFRCIHSIKGMSLNLGLDRLAYTSSILSEKLRHGEPGVDITDILNNVKADYYSAIEAIKDIDAD